MSAPASSKPFDIVVFGATGFTGRQAALYLAQNAAPSVRLAVAGRRPEKLQEVVEAIRATGYTRDVGIIIADSSQPEQITNMVAQTRVLLSTAGPYARYGEPVIAACARLGVDYVDITGETPWVRQMIDAYEADALRSGAKLVPMCGFDSVPSDLGAFMMVQHLREVCGVGTREVKAFFKAKGGVNGGTLASAFNLMEAFGLETFQDPLLLNPSSHRTEAWRALCPPDDGSYFDADAGRWAVPFFMASVNTRVVRRSAALAELAGEPYGKGMRYHEHMLLPGWTGAVGASLANGASWLGHRLVAHKQSRKLAQWLAPQPGEGPSDATMDRGFFEVWLFAEGEDGRKISGEIFNQGDPGNRSTVKMLCESALALLLQRDMLPGGAQRVGFLTPAFAFGAILLERLRKADMIWAVEEGD
ncbi:MAG: saccharopine dehydrogenase family protein [Myxococcota bacterium]